MLLPFDWRQGQHMAIIGRTGSGKSELAARLLSRRKYRIIIRTKPDDIVYPDTVEVSTLEGIEHRRGDTAIVLNPTYDRQAIEIWKAFEYIWRTGYWCVYLDELFYLIDQLGLEKQINKLLTQGRSKGVTVVSAMQRPARVSRFAISESTHVISFNVEGRETKTIEEATTRRMAEAVQRLERFDFAWYYANTRDIWTGRLDIKRGVLTSARQGVSV